MFKKWDMSLLFITFVVFIITPNLILYVTEDKLWTLSYLLYRKFSPSASSGFQTTKEVTPGRRSSSKTSEMTSSNLKLSRTTTQVFLHLKMFQKIYTGNGKMIFGSSKTRAISPTLLLTDNNASPQRSS